MALPPVMPVTYNPVDEITGPKSKLLPGEAAIAMSSQPLVQAFPQYQQHEPLAVMGVLRPYHAHAPHDEGKAVAVVNVLPALGTVIVIAYSYSVFTATSGKFGQRHRVYPLAAANDQSRPNH